MDDNCFYDVAARHARITALIEPFGWELYSYVVLPMPENGDWREYGGGGLAWVYSRYIIRGMSRCGRA